ncbi:hypothetical protein BDW74DRAFT_179147 [Aspergillus multicolor]|uniref:uncharacterized protein n=1 Tax=Aspergillus multicolor TaxID=41759 RepID=UPI003CCD3C52
MFSSIFSTNEKNRYKVSAALQQTAYPYDLSLSFIFEEHPPREKAQRSGTSSEIVDNGAKVPGARPLCNVIRSKNVIKEQWLVTIFMALVIDGYIARVKPWTHQIPFDWDEGCFDVKCLKEEQREDDIQRLRFMNELQAAFLLMGNGEERQFETDFGGYELRAGALRGE